MGSDGRQDLLAIGRFARLAGLSVGALRHYDDLDVLRPARVDPETGYRSYRRDQLETARTIVLLRDLEVPLEIIRGYMGTDDPAQRRRLMGEHRLRIEARTHRLQRVLHVVGQLAGATTAIDPATIDPATKESQPITASTIDLPTDLDDAAHRALAAALFNHVWTLLEKPDRTAAETDELIHAAHASRLHWSRAESAEAINLGRGEWQCSRVYAVLGRGEPALWHARRYLGYVDGAGAEDWDRAAAFEAMARASAVAGDPGAAVEWRAKAVSELEDIKDRDDREVIEGDIATLPV